MSRAGKILGMIEATAETDKAFRKKAQTAAKKVLSLVKKQGDWEVIIGNNTLCVSMVPLKLKDFKKMLVVLRPKNEHPGMAGSYQKPHKEAEGYSWANVYCLEPGDLQSSDPGKTFYTRLNKPVHITTLEHELFHHLDQMRYKGEPDVATSRHMDAGDQEKYYNNPVEFNAHFQERISKFEKWVNKDYWAKIRLVGQSEKELIDSVKKYCEELLDLFTGKYHKKVLKRIAVYAKGFKEEVVTEINSPKGFTKLVKFIEKTYRKTWKDQSKKVQDSITEPDVFINELDHTGILASGYRLLSKENRHSLVLQLSRLFTVLKESKGHEMSRAGKILGMIEASAKADKDVRKKATVLVKKIATQAKKNSRMISMTGEFAYFYLKDIGIKDFPHLQIQLVQKSKKQLGTFNPNYSHPIITLYCLDDSFTDAVQDWSPEKVVLTVLKCLKDKQVQSTLVHELIHHLDQLRYKGDVDIGTSRYSDVGDWEKYFNNPVEFNAHFQQEIAKFEAWLAKEYMIRLRHAVESDKEMIQSVVSFFSDYKKEYFKGKYKQKLLKRIAVYVEGFKADTIKEVNSKRGFEKLANYIIQHVNDVFSTLPKQEREEVFVNKGFESFIKELHTYTYFKVAVKLLDKSNYSKLEDRLLDLFKKIKEDHILWTGRKGLL